MKETTELFNTQIGITGSPNTVDLLHIQITNEVLDKDFELEGTIVTVPANKDRVIVAQLRKVEARNRWHENDQLGSFIAHKGSLPHLTGSADVFTCYANILGVYRTTEKGEWKKDVLGIPLGTGHAVYRLTNEVVKKIVEETGFGNDFYIGRFYGSETFFPSDLRSYGDKTISNGHGEAYMGGIFGPSGSGKSVMLTNILTGFARNKDMGILLFDPQGEFSNNKMNKPPSFPLNFHTMLQSARPLDGSNGSPFVKERDIIKIQNIQIKDIELFTKLLRLNGFFSKLSISKTDEVCIEVNDLILRQNKVTGGSFMNTWNNLDNGVDLPDKRGGAKMFKEMMVRAIANAYADPDKEEERFLNRWQSETNDSLRDIWDESVKYFLDDGTKQDIGRVIREVVEGGRIVMLDISDQEARSEEKFKKYMLNYIMRQFRSYSRRHYVSSSATRANALIVMDEAHLFAGNNRDGGIDEELSRTLSENIAMMRKQNCGILLTTQFITQIRQEIFRQLHYRIYASGLIGPDKEWMKDKEGLDGVSLYEKLPDPKQSGKYCYLLGGNLSTVGSLGKPIIIEGLEYGEVDLRTVNKL